MTTTPESISISLMYFDNSNRVFSEQKAPYITQEKKDNKSCRYLMGV